jgi:hypothetical protein
VVDVDDLLEVVNSWGLCASCPADLTLDEVVNIEDLAIVIENWTF